MEDKVKNPLPAPNCCDSCCSLNIQLTTNDIVYGRIYGEWPLVYFCNDCRAAVGCHPGTEIPLGRMADRTTRQLRKKAHDAFDPLWRSHYMSREKAYRWLARELGIEESDCHISMLGIDQLKCMIVFCREYLFQNQEALSRRRIKNDERINKRNERERKRNGRHNAKRRS